MNAAVYVSTFADPYCNLALENALLAQINAHSLFLYQNRPCVVIGRAQNPWIEADVQYLREHGIPLVRRQSGGGTVVHDLGNLNFSFISPKAVFNKEANIEFVQQTLTALNLPVDIRERCDLFIGDKKISGSAFRETRKNCFHHGTLLIKSDLDQLRRCLKVPEHRIQTNAIPSRRSPVMNLAELAPALTIETVKQALIKSEPILLNAITLQDWKIAEIQKLYQSEEWIYKRILPFNEQISFNNETVTLYVEEGVIVQMEPIFPALKDLLGQDYHQYRFTK